MRLAGRRRSTARGRGSDQPGIWRRAPSEEKPGTTSCTPRRQVGLPCIPERRQPQSTAKGWGMGSTRVVQTSISAAKRQQRRRLVDYVRCSCCKPMPLQKQMHGVAAPVHFRVLRGPKRLGCSPRLRLPPLLHKALKMELCPHTVPSKALEYRETLGRHALKPSSSALARLTSRNFDQKYFFTFVDD